MSLHSRNLTTKLGSLQNSQHLVEQLENERIIAKEKQNLLSREKSEEIQELRRKLDSISEEFIKSQNKGIEELREDLAHTRKSLEEEEKNRQNIQEAYVNLQIQMNAKC